ncbi:MAG TPA: dTDP-4-dehydrorhamnose 3,5-epimerase [Deltaproteobacteria bacterium]|nr:dTDP-4-dehydrorhamnose 3,5-epimerase [Deltaproteobacteria bacterium]HCP45983.1 dTDP-4-dehydrorhamnose 3,5-epimerase [Deltaproteobacteria bacterium]
MVYPAGVPGDPNPLQPARPTAIEGVLIQELGWFTDQRGSLSVLLRGDDPDLRGDQFGQAYVTTVLPGVVKAWHCHQAQWDRMVGMVGRTLLVLVDGRAQSSTRGQVVEHVLGDRHPSLVLIPPGVWHGLKAIGASESMVLNLTTTPYNLQDPDEVRAPPHGPPAAGLAAYDWAREDG